MILETCLIFKIEKKKTKKRFFCGKATVNPLRKKTRSEKTQIALLGHVPGFRSARENACPMGREFYCRWRYPTLRILTHPTYPKWAHFRGGEDVSIFYSIFYVFFFIRIEVSRNFGLAG
jgi:hypothetical protein